MNLSPDLSSLSGSPLKKWPPSKRVLIITVVVLIIIIIAAVWFYLGSQAETPVNLGSAILGQSKVEVRREYKNPFDRDNQFVNPFAEVKSPFTVLQ